MKPQQYASDWEEFEAITRRFAEMTEEEQQATQTSLKAILLPFGRVLFLGVKMSLGIDRNGYTVFRDLDPGFAFARYLLRLVTLLLVIAGILAVAFIPLLFINPLAAGAFLLVDLGLVGIIVLVFVLCLFSTGAGPGRGVRRGRFIADMGGAFGRFVGGAR